jgi:hypothetical protein
MRWLTLLLCLTQCSCAVYTVASTATWVATDKTITDHAVTSVVPNGDCRTSNLVTGKYYCEVRDISRTYNRNGI